MIWLYYDSLAPDGGGINTYLYALAIRLLEDNANFGVCVNEISPTPIMDELLVKGVHVYRQRPLPGDRWRLRKRAMQWHLGRLLRPGDWVFSLCQPDSYIYHHLVKMVHRKEAKLAVSWFLAPEFWQLESSALKPYKHYANAVLNTDLLVSVAQCTAHQFAQFYSYQGRVAVIPYHNLLLFDAAMPMLPGPPWKIGYAGRIESEQKNLDGLLRAFAELRSEAAFNIDNVEFHLYGGGPDIDKLRRLAADLEVAHRVIFHGRYNYRTQLASILSGCHFFVYPSRSEGGPCFSTLEIMQAGRYCVASDVGGLPDLYAGHPEAGLLVAREDHEALVQGLGTALNRVVAGEIDPNRVRARYFEGFDMESAHRAFRDVFTGLL